MEDYMAGCQCEVLGFRIADDESMKIREEEQPQRYSLGDPAEILKDKAPCSAIADSCKNFRQFILLRRAQMYETLWLNWYTNAMNSELNGGREK